MAGPCLVLEGGVEPDRATAFLQAAARNKGRFTWLAPPASLGAVTVKGVHRAASATEHERHVRAWAESARHLVFSSRDASRLAGFLGAAWRVRPVARVFPGGGSHATTRTSGPP